MTALSRNKFLIKVMIANYAIDKVGNGRSDSTTVNYLHNQQSIK